MSTPNTPILMVGTKEYVGYNNEQYDSYYDFAKDNGMSLTSPYYDCAEEDHCIGINISNSTANQAQFNDACIKEIQVAFIKFKEVTGMDGTLMSATDLP